MVRARFGVSLALPPRLRRSARVTRSSSVLPIPDSGPLRTEIDAMIAGWPYFAATVFPWPRSRWLSLLESRLALYFPAASSRDRNLTARSLAPFPLAEKDWL